MLRYMLDTNLCIRVLRDRPAALRMRFNQAAEALAISTIVLTELLHGAAKLARPVENRREVERMAARLAVLPFDNNARNGTVALWYVTADAPLEAGRKLEAPYVDDRPHGVWRSWHPGGALRAEYRYEHGVLVDARGWTDAGEPLSEAAARGQAAGDAEADEQVVAALLALVAANRPACDEARAAAGG